MKQFEVWVVNLNPVKGSEIAKKRPCVVVSPDDLNRQMRTCIVAPLTRTRKKWRSRVRSRFRGIDGAIALDQMRCIDWKARGLHSMGSLDDKTIEAVKRTLSKMFR